MDDATLERLSHDIEDLKKAVKRNEPAIREIMTPPAWIWLSLGGGAAISLFALPAHVLTARYGSFPAIPPAWKAALWAMLAVFVVGGGLFKWLVIMKRSAEMGSLGTWKLFKIVIATPSVHVSLPLFGCIAAAIVFSVATGHPWYAVPASAMLFGIESNLLATRTGVRSYYSLGYWGLAWGGASLAFIESAPFLWLFAIYGGMFFAFAAGLALGRGKGGSAS